MRKPSFRLHRLSELPEVKPLGLSEKAKRPAIHSTQLHILMVANCVQALQEQHIKDLQLQMLQEAGRNNHPSLAGPLAPLQSQNPVNL